MQIMRLQRRMPNHGERAKLKRTFDSSNNPGDNQQCGDCRLLRPCRVRAVRATNPWVGILAMTAICRREKQMHVTVRNAVLVAYL
jgi:hypothetical protein